MANKTIVLGVSADEWRKLYLEDQLTLRELGEKFGCAHPVIRRHLEAVGIQIKGRGNLGRKRADSYEWYARYEEIAMLANQGLNGLEISRRTGIPYGSVYHAIRTKKAFQVKIGSWAIRYTVNHDYFDVIDTEEKAYWLGFLVADGSAAGKNIVRLHLAVKDRDQVQKFLDAIGSDAPISYAESIKSVSATVTSEKLNKVLLSAKKEMSLPDIDHELIRHWIRGYWDGDGHVNMVTRLMSLCGPEERLKAIAECLTKEVGITPTSLAQASNGSAVHDLRYSRGADGLALANWLYSNCSIALPRKLDAAECMLPMLRDPYQTGGRRVYTVYPKRLENPEAKPDSIDNV